MTTIIIPSLHIIQPRTARSLKQKLRSASTAIALLMALNPGIVAAQPCFPATMFGTTNMAPFFEAQASSSMGPAGPFGLFIGVSCPGAPLGGMGTVCGSINTAAGAALYAIFPSSAANTSNAGCTFMCPGPPPGTCSVKGGAAQGMPVELMEFEIEE